MADKTDKSIGLGILGVIITAVIIIGFVTVFLDGINEFTPDDACSVAGCSFNNPSGFCAINSSAEGSGITCPNDVRESLPLTTLFTVALVILFAIGMFVAIRKTIKEV